VASRKKRNSSGDASKNVGGPLGSSATTKTGILYGPLLHSVLIVAVGLIAYSNTFQVPFQFDDLFNIRDNPIIKDFKYFVEPSRAKTLLLYSALRSRFVGYLTFALNYKLHGLTVAGYHIFNLAIHVMSALLLYWLVVLTCRTPAMKPSQNGHQQVAHCIALFSALLFVAHPIQTEAVTYIVQRLASLATLFYLLSLTSYIQSRLSLSKARRFTFYAVSLLSAILAMKTKEIAFTLPVMITLYEFMFFEGQIKRRILSLIPLLLTMVIIPFTLIGMGKPVGELISDVSEATRVQTAMSRWDYLFTQFRVIVTYIRLLLFPVGQNLDYDYPLYHSFFSPPVFLSFLVLAAILSFGIYVFRYRKLVPHTRLISFGILWFFVALSVESSFIPIEDVIYEHRMYLPSVGMFIAVMTSLFLARDQLTRGEKIIIPSCMLIVIILASVTYARNMVWQSEVALYRDVVRGSPHKARGHNNLGNAYLKQNRLDEAVHEFITALKLNPDYAMAHNNLGDAYVKQKRLDEAIHEFITALKLDSDLTEAHNNLGTVYLMQNRLDEAVHEFITALKLNPDLAEAHNNLGDAYVKQKHLDEAVHEFITALKLSPNYEEAHYNLGTVYLMQKRLDEAVHEFITALKLNPNYEEARNNLGYAYLDQNRFDEAVHEFIITLKLNPADTEARNNLGTAYLKQNRFDEAMREFITVLKLNPVDTEARNNLEICHERIKTMKR
jgi:Flp pilus assembly protein TadD